MRKSSSSSTKTPSFFKVLIASDFDKKLRIPSGFMKHFDGKLPSQFTLKTPTKKSWTIQVKEVDKDLFFCDGWEDFVDQHSLEFGDFLVFKYYAYSKFRVKIFGRNACEKELNLNNETPISCVEKEKGGKVELSRDETKRHPNFSGKSRDWRTCRMTIPWAFGKETGLFTKKYKLMLEDPKGNPWPVKLIKRRDNRLDMSDGWAQFCKGNNVKAGDEFLFEYDGRKGNTVYVRVNIFRDKGTAKSTTMLTDEDECSPGLKTSYTHDKKNELHQFDSKGVMNFTTSEDELEVISIHSDDESYNEYGRDGSFNEEKETNGSVGVTCEKMRGVKGRGFESSKAFVSKYPFCMITMWPSYVSKNFNLCIPSHFANLYLYHRRPSSLILQVPDGRTWYIYMNFARYTCCVTRGWNSFVLDNRLAEGDVCIWELVDFKNFKINVSIIRVSEDEEV